MIDQTELLAMIDALRSAIFSGARRISYRGVGGTKEVEYRSLDEMRSALAQAEAQAGITRRRPRTSLIGHSRGL